MKRIYQISAESCCRTHPDKVADAISDAVLQAFFEQDKDAHVACETMVTENFVLLAGEYKANADVNVEQVVREKIKELGYDEPVEGFAHQTVEILNKLHAQSGDIDMGVSRGTPETEGSGDQGFMIGYATDESENFMPLPISLAKALTDRLTEVQEKGITKWLLPDGKAQVVIQYTVEDLFDEEQEQPQGDQVQGNFAIVPSEVTLKSVLVSNHHCKNVPMREVREEIIEHVIKPVVEEFNFTLEGTDILVNPTGAFTIGGPAGDTGLTGRKIVVDNYGPACPVGGGCYSGKDLSKTDRCGAYMARYIAKNIVGADLAQTCQVQLSYAIGVAEPTSINIDTFGTNVVPEQDIENAVRAIFDCRPGMIRKWITDAGINFNDVCRYGAYGNNKFPWEQLDKVGELTKYFGGQEIIGTKADEEA